jgi:dimethylglycine dehydrogenase
MNTAPQAARQDHAADARLAAEGAEFTVVNGWERVDYIKPSPDFHPSLTFRFDEAFDVVAAK